MAEFNHAEFAAAHVRAMTDTDIDRVSGMSLFGTNGWEKVAEDIRSTLALAYEDGTVIPRHPHDGTYALAEGLVPSSPSDRMFEFAIIGAARRLTLSVNDPDGADDGVPLETGTIKAMDVIGALLGKAYENGLGALVTHLEAQADTAEQDHDEDDEDDEDDEGDEVPSHVTLVGPVAGHWWATWHGGEYIEVYRHEASAHAGARSAGGTPVHAINTTGDEIGEDRAAYVTQQVAEWAAVDGADYLANM